MKTFNIITRHVFTILTFLCMVAFLKCVLIDQNTALNLDPNTTNYVVFGGLFAFILGSLFLFLNSNK